jgi:hypothetical protein
MREDEIQETEDMISTLSDSHFLNDAKEIQKVDPMDDLKFEILKFFKTRVASISRADSIKEMAYRQLEGMIQGGELNFDQLMGVIRQVANENNSSADSIMSIFRYQGGPNGGSPLQDMMRPLSDKGDLAKAFDNMSPEELRKINTTMLILRDIVESGRTVDLEDGKGVVKDQACR